MVSVLSFNLARKPFSQNLKLFHWIRLFVCMLPCGCWIWLVTQVSFAGIMSGDRLKHHNKISTVKKSEIKSQRNTKSRPPRVILLTVFGTNWRITKCCWKKKTTDRVFGCKKKTAVCLLQACFSWAMLTTWGILWQEEGWVLLSTTLSSGGGCSRTSRICTTTRPCYRWTQGLDLTMFILMFYRHYPHQGWQTFTVALFRKKKSIKSEKS